MNPYVQQALDRILEPVVDGVSKLKTTAQLSAISMAVTKMCEAWTSFILKEKIKFRYCKALYFHGPQGCH
jgi:hypothetical protein